MLQLLRLRSGGICPVPNVPCGVERRVCQLRFLSWLRFLMYRVELKDTTPLGPINRRTLIVPNVPCGVESRAGQGLAPCPLPCS